MTAHTARQSETPIVSRSLAALLAGAGLAFIAAAPAIAQQYHLTDMGTLGAPYSLGQAINSSGAAVGFSAQPNADFHAFAPALPTPNLIPLAGFSQSHAFAVSDTGAVAAVCYNLGGLQPHGMLVDGAAVTDLGVMTPLGMNAGGTIVGSSAVLLAGSGWVDRPALWQNGSMTLLVTLGGESATASAINTAGYAVGWSWTTNNAAVHAALWAGSGALDLGTLGGTKSQAYAINDSLQVAGWSTNAAGVPRGFVYQLTLGGTVTSRRELGVLSGARASYAFGINSAGDAVGVSGSKAVIWPAGSVTPVDLNTAAGAVPGWVFERAHAINARGQIVGEGKLNGFPRGFILTPGPACLADFNADGNLNPDDLGDYITCYFTEPPCDRADFNADGNINPDDLGDFITTYFQGC